MSPRRRGICSCGGASSQLLQQSELLLLGLHQFGPFLIANLVQLGVQRHDLNFRLGVHFIVVLRVQPVFYESCLKCQIANRLVRTHNSRLTGMSR